MRSVNLRQGREGTAEVLPESRNSNTMRQSGEYAIINRKSPRPPLPPRRRSSTTQLTAARPASPPPLPTKKPKQPTPPPLPPKARITKPSLELVIDSTPPSAEIEIDFESAISAEPAIEAAVEAPANLTVSHDDLDLQLDLDGPISNRDNWFECAPEAASPNFVPQVKVVDITPSVDERAALARFAGYGPPPTTTWGCLRYALRVSARRWIVQRDMQIARRRCNDISVYQRALHAADASAVHKGLCILIGLVMGACMLMFAAGMVIDAFR